jgi:hypothetical protein
MTTPLEARYLRLLRCYPRAHRRAHGPDMLTTMLDDAGPGQRWPRPGDAANLVFHGLRLRLLRANRGGLFDTGWADACALIGPLAALLLLASRVAVLPGMHGILHSPTAQVLAWALVAAAAILGLRRTAALLGWAALLAEVVPVVRQYDDAPVVAIGGLWRPALAAVAALALTAAGRRPFRAVFGIRRLATVLAALAALDAIAILGAPGPVSERVLEGGSFYEFYPGDLLGTQDGPVGFSIESASWSGLLLMLGGAAVALIALAIAALTVPGRLRRRLVVAAAPVVTVALVVDRGLHGWAASNYHMGHAIPLVTGQWLSLFLLPVVVFAAGAWWVRRRDETLRLAALGATIDADGAALP